MTDRPVTARPGTTLVVGATGQLGRAVVARLLRDGRPVRALVRSPERARELADAGAELAVGDLRDAASLERAVDGVTFVVATANSTTPRRGDRLDTDSTGMARLVAAADEAGVSRFVYPSTGTSAIDAQVPVIAAKRYVEERLAASRMSYVVARFPMLTDVWLAIVGSSIPLRGEPHHTLRRPFGFLQRYRAMTGTSVERRGVMLVPGPARRRQAFITVADAAAVLVAALDAPWLDRKVVDVGGPEVLDWNDVSRVFSVVLGRPVKVRTTPEPVFAIAQRALRPFAPFAANIMALDRFSAVADAAYPPKVAHDLGIDRLTTVAEYLTAKARLPAE